MNAKGPSWLESAGRAWFLLRTLATRSRFMIGKASFVSAQVCATSNSLTEVIDAGGRPPRMRLLSHYQLETQKPRSGSQGWRLFEHWARARTAHGLICLECGYCGHTYMLQVLPGEPMAAGPGDPRPLGRPASYRSSWFSFPDEDFEGEASLNCGHCEQRCPPEVNFLGEHPEAD